MTSSEYSEISLWHHSVLWNPFSGHCSTQNSGTEGQIVTIFPIWSDTELADLWFPPCSFMWMWMSNIQILTCFMLVVSCICCNTEYYWHNQHATFHLLLRLPLLCRWRKKQSTQALRYIVIHKPQIFIFYVSNTEDCNLSPPGWRRFSNGNREDVLCSGKPYSVLKDFL